MTTLDETLAHFGVKGMKWGVRRMRRPSFSSDSSSDDARRAEAAKKKVKTSGTKSLTNKELQDLVTRMNLEQQFDKLKPPSPGAKTAKFAAKFISDFLLGVGKQQASKLANDYAAQKISELLKKA